MHARAYILYLLGCQILSDTRSNKIHLRYLRLLEDFDSIKNYGWVPIIQQRKSSRVPIPKTCGTGGHKVVRKLENNVIFIFKYFSL